MDSTSHIPEVKVVIAKASVAIKEKDYQKAISLCQDALQDYPEQADLKARLAFALHRSEQYEQAEALYRELLERYDNAILYFNLACLLTTLDRQDEAVPFYEKTLQLEPNHRGAHNNLGNILRGQGKIQEAVSHFEIVQADYPEHINSLTGLGACYATLGEHEKSVAHFQKVIELKPDDFHSHTNLGIELLLMGQFETGWKEYNWRFLRPDLKRKFSCPLWQGENLEKKRLLIHAEQGAGDVIQFMRYVPHVKTLGAEIVFECHKNLYTLCYQQSGIDIVVALDTKLPKCDYHIPLISLAEVFKTDVDNIPNQIPYLCVPEDINTKWEAIVSQNDKFKIGIVWAGNPEHSNDNNRSCDLDLFIPFLQHEQIDYYSLQKSFRLSQLEALPENIHITNLDSKIFDYQDTAACILQLDLVITVDTSVAHLAGALGKDVWVLLPYVPDWRWMLNTEYSPWYPTMHLFRQDNLGDWAPVIERINQSLVRRISDANYLTST